MPPGYSESVSGTSPRSRSPSPTEPASPPTSRCGSPY